jgi:hypothetical protein
MSRGCLLFAFNNESTDYVKLANASAKNIHRHLNTPTSIVTDKEVTFEHSFDKVIIVDKPKHGSRYFNDYNKSVSWVNYARCQAYNLTPYTQTILLDADYVVASDQLSTLFLLDKSFLCHKHSYDVTYRDFTTQSTFSMYGMPMSWATVVYFKKDYISKNIFDVMKMVEDNYQHYALLYNFNKFPYRNDYALSIATNINSGHFINSDEYYIPWHLASISHEHYIEKIGTDAYQIKYKKQVQNKPQLSRIIIRNQDLHVMGKMYLEQIYES